jgi:hypothetical protein
MNPRPKHLESVAARIMTVFVTYLFCAFNLASAAILEDILKSANAGDAEAQHQLGVKYGEWRRGIQHVIKNLFVVKKFFLKDALYDGR